MALADLADLPVTLPARAEHSRAGLIPRRRPGWRPSRCGSREGQRSLRIPDVGKVTASSPPAHRPGCPPDRQRGPCGARGQCTEDAPRVHRIPGSGVGQKLAKSWRGGWGKSRAKAGWPDDVVTLGMIGGMMADETVWRGTAAPPDLRRDARDRPGASPSIGVAKVRHQKRGKGSTLPASVAGLDRQQPHLRARARGTVYSTA